MRAFHCITLCPLRTQKLPMRAGIEVGDGVGEADGLGAEFFEERGAIEVGGGVGGGAVDGDDDGDGGVVVGSMKA